jgi:hypothetical protein
LFPDGGGADPLRFSADGFLDGGGRGDCQTGGDAEVGEDELQEVLPAATDADLEESEMSGRRRE